MDAPDRSVGQGQAKFQVAVLPVTRRTVDGLGQERPIIRMRTLHNRIDRRRGGSIVGKDSKGLLRPQHLARSDVATEAARAAEVLGFGEEGFAASHEFFRLFPLLDIRHQLVPADDVALGVTLRDATEVAPAVHAISATAAMLHIERLPGFDECRKRVDQARHVVRMDRIAGGPRFHFLECLAEVFQHPAVDVLNLACCIGCGHKPRDAVDHQAEVVFARAKRLLHALPVVDVGQQHVPADGTTLRIASGKGACLEPTVHAVRTALAEFEIVGLPCLDRVSPCRDRARQVLGMDRIAHLPILQLRDRLTEVIEELAVEQLDSARGIQGAHKPRDAVDDEAKPLLTRRVLAGVVGDRLGPHQVMLYPPCYAFLEIGA